MSDKEKEFFDNIINIIRDYYNNNVWRQTFLDVRIKLDKNEEGKWIIKCYQDPESNFPNYYMCNTMAEAIQKYVELVSSNSKDCNEIMNIITDSMNSPRR